MFLFIQIYNYKNHNKETKVARLGPGEYFGEMSFLTGDPRIATVRTVTTVRVLEIKKDYLELIIKNRPEIADTLSQIVLERKQTNLSHIKNLTLKKSEFKKEKQQLLLKIKKFFKLKS